MINTKDDRTQDPKITDLDAEDDNVEDAEESPTGGRSKQSRLEKKSRRVLSRLGLKPVPGIVEITIKKSKHLLFSITNPEVFKSPTSDTYVIFGDAKIDDATSSTHNKVASAFNSTSEMTTTTKPGATEVVDDGPVDTTGVAEKDIELVMSQGMCSRAKAVAALRDKNNDIVEAIMAVSII